MGLAGRGDDRGGHRLALDRSVARRNFSPSERSTGDSDDTGRRSRLTAAFPLAVMTFGGTATSSRPDGGSTTCMTAAFIPDLEISTSISSADKRRTRSCDSFWDKPATRSTSAGIAIAFRPCSAWPAELSGRTSATGTTSEILPDGCCRTATEFMFLCRNQTFALRPPQAALDFTASAHFQDCDFSNSEAFRMILEILAIIFLIQCVSMLAQFIGRRRDVFHYVSKSNPHRNAF
jgi:hypothetical protein